MIGVPLHICNFGGRATLGGTQSWINGGYAAHGTKAHELGHNFRSYHSGFFDCGTKQINTFSLCTFYNYGERNEKMGSSNESQFGSARRHLFGWIPSTQLVAVNSGGTYTLASDYSTSTTQSKILKIPKYDTNDNYYITFKQAAGFNAGLGSGNTRGASIYYKPNGVYGTSNQSDTVLLSAQPDGLSDGADYTNSALWDGGSFVDAINGITITQLSHTADTVTLDVKLTPPPCTPANPTISVSPASQTGPSGATVAYTATVVNKNSTYCGPSIFTISPIVPPGFTSSPASLNLTSNASGATNFSVTSDVGTLDGSYPFTVEAFDTVNSGKSTTQATYIVYTPVPDTTPPVVSISSPTSGAKVSGRTNIIASATDNIGVAKVEFYIDSKLVTTDTTAPYSYTWNINKKVSNGTHTIMVKAYDVALNSASASVSVTK